MLNTKQPDAPQSSNTLDLRAPQPAPTVQRVNPLRRLKPLHWLLASGLVAAGAGAFAVYYFNTPIPRSVRHGVSYPLYYPANLPAGYSVDRTSFKNQDGVLIFSIKTPNGKNIAVSEQAVPLNLDLHPVSNAPVKIPGERDFTTPIGKGHVGLWSDKYVADITTDDTWIITNATGFTADQSTEVARSFHPVR
jgi:hypothetical protein